MKTLVVLCGVPGSGKTTWAHEQSRAKVISRDEIRFKIIKNDEEYFSHEKEVFKEFIRQIKEALYSNDPDYDHVIADATHLNYNSRAKLLNHVFGTLFIDENDLRGYPIHFIYFDTPIEVCLKRNNNRTGRERVPEDVIINMYENFTKPPLETIIVKNVRSEYIWEKST